MWDPQVKLDEQVAQAQQVRQETQVALALKEQQVSREQWVQLVLVDHRGLQEILV
jgi:hypothetical protein